MPVTAAIKLAVARELAEAGSVRAASLTGEQGGYRLTLRTDASERVLATKDGQPRLFPRLEAAAKLLRELGIQRFEVDASNHVAAEARRRPDRAEAMRVKEADARYAAFLHARTVAALAAADAAPDAGFSSTEAKAQMGALKSALQRQLDEATQGAA